MNPRSASRFLLAFLALFVTSYALVKVQGPKAPSVRKIPWSGGGIWLSADLHTHTKFSDGAHSVADVVAAAAKNACDVVAITDHTDAELKAATAEYVESIRAARAGA